MAAVMVGQPVQFEDNDQTLHNIHPMPKNNPEWNQSQMPHTHRAGEEFQPARVDDPGKVQPASLDAHVPERHWKPVFRHHRQGWQVHPPGIPPGTYTIAAVQEKYGREDADDYDVGPEEDKNLNFSYQP